MKKAEVYVQDTFSGILEELENKTYVFTYAEHYLGPSVSLTMPTHNRVYTFDTFPPFFEGLLPEGFQLNALLRSEKIDKTDYMTQLITVGADLVGDVTVRSAP